jgi:hypothetical protein
MVIQAGFKLPICISSIVGEIIDTEEALSMHHNNKWQMNMESVSGACLS